MAKAFGIPDKHHRKRSILLHALWHSMRLEFMQKTIRTPDHQVLSESGLIGCWSGAPHLTFDNSLGRDTLGRIHSWRPVTHVLAASGSGEAVYPAVLVKASGMEDVSTRKAFHLGFSKRCQTYCAQLLFLS